MPTTISAGRGYVPAEMQMGARWNIDAMCGNFDIGTSVSNNLNGLTNGFQNLMGDVIQNASGAVASLPAMIIQRANPQLYDLLSNGVMQGRLDFDKSKLSCQAMASTLADYAFDDGVQQAAQAENWQDAAQSTRDPVVAQEVVDAQGGNKGRSWVGGQKRGGTGQQPIRIVEDVAIAGYNQLHGRTNPTSQQPVSGGGGGWGSVATDSGTWPGGGSDTGTGSGQCWGGMCTIWSTPQEAADWVKTVAGETELQTCDGCEKRRGQAGTGLMRDLEIEQEQLATDIANLANGSTEPTADNLRRVSAGPGLAVSRSVIDALRSDPSRDLLIHRLAGEMALSRTLTKAMWGRRLLLAGSNEPGIANNEEGLTELDRRLEGLNRDIDALKSELEVRTMLANNAATIALKRADARSAGFTNDEHSQLSPSLDSRGRPVNGGDE